MCCAELTLAAAAAPQLATRFTLRVSRQVPVVDLIHMPLTASNASRTGYGCQAALLARLAARVGQHRDLARHG